MKESAVAFKDKMFFWYKKYMMVAGVLGQCLFFTQGLKIFSTKSAGDVSIVGFCFGFVSVVSWLLYGIVIKDKVLILSNIVAVIGVTFVLIGILVYG